MRGDNWEVSDGHDKQRLSDSLNKITWSTSSLLHKAHVIGYCFAMAVVCKELQVCITSQLSLFAAISARFDVCLVPALVAEVLTLLCVCVCLCVCA